MPPASGPGGGALPVAEVIVDVAAVGIDRPLDYLVPADLAPALEVGHRVVVPLQNRRVEGFVIGRRMDSPREGLRAIEGLVDTEPAFGAGEVGLARWLAERYLALQVDGLRCFLPPHVRLGLKNRLRSPRPAPPPRYRLAEGVAGRMDRLVEEKGRRAPAQLRLLQALAALPEGAAGLPRPQLLAQAQASAGPLQALVEQGLVEVVEDAGAARGPAAEAGGPGGGGEGPAVGAKPAALTADQAHALRVIGQRLEGPGVPRPLLLQGVTGSGKTEVYMQAAEQVLRRQGQALILVPEIVLTPQMVDRLRARFGSRVALVHSRLAAGERVDAWWRIRRGEAPLVVGTRSAVFAPLDRLRLIVIDEEHEPSYKQEESPRYHAREVAWERAKQSGALLVLGSATPSAETYYKVQQGALDVVHLPTRVHGGPLPPMELVDMREELREGHRGILSRRLLDGMGRVLARGGQVMLFLNRRGYSSFLLCRECGCVLTCPDCAVSLTYHAVGAPLRCHYCDRRQPLPRECPRCTSRLLRRFGAGTQRVEEAVRAAFPHVNVLRMDMDTTRRKGDFERILGAFRRQEAQVLVGTQMIAKGHDFPNVALVGAIAADSSLHLPDFRSAERTFQLLTQAAGRAGRAGVEGHVLVQTYNPDHYSVRAAQQYDLPGFFQQELRFRRAGGYPPFKYLARILLVGGDWEAVAEGAKGARREAHGALRALPVDVLGPAPAPIPRLQERYRWHLLVKGTDGGAVREAAAALRQAAMARAGRDVTVMVDVDPVSIM